MAKEKNTEQYGDVIARLQMVVESLEGGKLSLEDSLDRFAEGVSLVKQGEKLLGDAEKRIEQLLSEDGRTAPLRLSETSPESKPSAEPAQRAQPSRSQPPRAAPASPSHDDDDVPF